MTLTGKTQAQLDAEKNIQLLKEEQNYLQDYLDATDWYVTRLVERNITIPADVTAQRLANVERLNVLKGLLNG